MREGSAYLGDFSNKLCLLRLHDLCRETNTNTLIISVFADTHSHLSDLHNPKKLRWRPSTQVNLSLFQQTKPIFLIIQRT